MPLKPLKKCLLFLLLPLLAFSGIHKFYVSVTQVAYSQKEESIQITSRIFIDDFEALLQQRYGIEAGLGTKEESDMADAYIEQYLKVKFVLRINGREIPYKFLGKRYDNDIMVCYLESVGHPLEMMTSIEVQNEVLTDLYEEQKNIVHFNINDLKQSFVLVRENSKGMLNL